MTNKYLYLNTIGCQMNVYDSEQIAMRLAALGYQQTSSLENADLVIVNTCTIRAKAEQKAFSFLGRLARLKKKKPGLITAIGGCVAQQEGETILKRDKSVDVVFGPDNFFKLPEMIQQVKAGERVVLYSYRHTFGTESSGRVSDIELAELMGHTEVRTTHRYVHLNVDRLHDIRRRVEG